MHPNPNTKFQLPILDHLQRDLASSNPKHVACRAPLVDGSLQVGFKGTPEGMGVVDITEHNGLLSVDLHGIPIEGPVIDHRNRTVTRHTTPKIGVLQLKTSDNGDWEISGDRDPELSGNDRLVLSRTLAKLGERATAQISRS